MKKLLALSLATMSMMVAFSGCGPEEQKFNEDKTQLFVAISAGGVGDAWFSETKTRFENDYANYKLGDKEGVEIVFDTTKSVSGNSLTTALATTNYEIYFTELVYYRSFVASGDFLDITDMVTETIEEDGKSIEDKLTDYQRGFYKVNGKYYGLPHYEDTYSAFYDIDMFQHYELYFAGNTDEANNPALYEIDEETGDKVFTMTNGKGMPLSAGPDGEVGNTDDGLPATAEQFLYLCGVMVESGISPLSFSGTNPFYVTRWLRSIATGFTGASNAQVQFSFDGTEHTGIIDTINPNGTVTLKEATALTAENGYLSYYDVGKYYALDLLQKLTENQYFYSKTQGAYSHLQAQQDFILGSYKDAWNNPEIKKVGMLIDGSWWENESKTFFDEMVGRYGDNAARSKRNFGIIPCPKLNDEGIGDDALLVGTNLANVFIKSSIDQSKVALAKEFVKYFYTDQGLREFTVSTNMPKGVSYTLRDADKSAMSKYGLSLWELRENSTRVFPYSSHSIYAYNASAFAVDSGWDSLLSTKVSVPVTYFFDTTGASAMAYMKGIMSNYTKEQWDSAYSKYFN